MPPVIKIIVAKIPIMILGFFRKLRIVFELLVAGLMGGLEEAGGVLSLRMEAFIFSISERLGGGVLVGGTGFGGGGGGVSGELGVPKLGLIFSFSILCPRDYLFFLNRLEIFSICRREYSSSR